MSLSLAKYPIYFFSKICCFLRSQIIILKILNGKNKQDFRINNFYLLNQ